MLYINQDMTNATVMEDKNRDNSQVALIKVMHPVPNTDVDVSSKQIDAKAEDRLFITDTEGTATNALPERNVLPPFSDEQYQAVIDQREHLILKKYKFGLSKQEEQQLQLLTFQSYQLQMAREQNRMSELRVAAMEYAELAAEVSGLTEMLKGLPKRR